ncbi:hypothetical protein M409DRAFT_52201 [Zasmidium cellare ATCC 36951]|uniref:Uncharacterized protein n=1 Tax=Zasmidium cellare ATCC 36951 TaxID=1080233 RepID=A0A6A6CU31_ZASCE|nr:uncharacterized protein M409DRAFT_52201 [Zasmidium cellare ATCC 36951]KAF2169688.1 hypothetical protein M409DRAFT_52201 [Zasmidium cellare ATCC 36951]
MPEKRKFDGGEAGDDKQEAKRFISVRERESGKVENYASKIRANEKSHGPLKTILKPKRPVERKAVDDASTVQYGELKNKETEHTIALSVWNEHFAPRKTKWGTNFRHRVWEKLEEETQIARRKLIVQIHSVTGKNHVYYLCIPKAAKKEKPSSGNGGNRINQTPGTAIGKTTATTTTNKTSKAEATAKTPTATPGLGKPVAQGPNSPQRRLGEQSTKTEHPKRAVGQGSTQNSREAGAVAEQANNQSVVPKK